MKTDIVEYKPLIIIVYKTYDGSFKTYTIDKKHLKNFVEDLNRYKAISIPSEDVTIISNKVVDFVEPKTKIEKYVYSQPKDCRNWLLDIDAINNAKFKPDPLGWLSERVARFNENNHAEKE
jgi:hypothetical protein